MRLTLLLSGLSLGRAFVPGAVCASQDYTVCADLTCGTHTGSSSSLAGAHLRVLAYEASPYGWPVNGSGEQCPPDVGFCPEVNRTWRGFDFALLDALREELGFTYEVVGSFVGCNGFDPECADSQDQTLLERANAAERGSSAAIAI